MEEQLKKSNDDLTLVERLNSPTPKFFRNTRALSAIIFAAGIGLLFVPAGVSIAPTLISVGLGGMGLSQAAVDNK
jgi:hypothetical protein